MRITRIFLLCAMAEILVCAGAGQIGMPRRRSNWYAQAQVKLVCAGAGQIGCAGASYLDMHWRRSFFMRRCSSLFFSMCRAFIWYPITQVSFETHFKLFFRELIIFQTT